MSLKKGLVHIYTGPGKGKTTAALGLALRASGAGLKVFIIQFMKGRRYSEVAAIEKISGITLEQFGRDEFVSKEEPAQVDIDLAKKGFARARDVIMKGEHDVVILDELNVAADFNLVALEDILKLIKDKPAHVELILTGRYAKAELIEAADLVTEMGEIKHPYQKGVQSRRGIDF